MSAAAPSIRTPDCADALTCLCSVTMAAIFIRADPAGSLSRATRDVLTKLAVSSRSADEASADLDAALRVALGR